MSKPKGSLGLLDPSNVIESKPFMEFQHARPTNIPVNVEHKEAFVDPYGAAVLKSYHSVPIYPKANREES